jgi:hypothetical protein
LHIGTGIEDYGTSNSHWFNLKLAFRTGTGIALKKVKLESIFDFLKKSRTKTKTKFPFLKGKEPKLN